MRTVTVPTSIIVRRNDRPRHKDYTAQKNVRIPVAINPETSPGPVPYSSFFGVGRDAQHAWPHRWLYQSLAIEDKLSIRSSEVEGRTLTKKIPSARVIGMNVGRHIPMSEHADIESPNQTTYGALSALKGAVYGSPAYAKLGVYS